MGQIENPFVISPVIPAEYFCDRERETEQIADLLENGNNIVLKAERRIGKTTLLHYLINDTAIRDIYKPCFVDIFHTENTQGFAEALCSALYKSGIATHTKENLARLAKIFKLDIGIELGNVRANLSVTPADVIDVKDKKKTVEAIFDILEKSKERCLIIFDEFQQINGYPEKHLDALLRTRIQRLPGIRFIFSGSERRLLDHMFNTSSEPFYRSCTDIELTKIPKNVYVDFAETMFRKFDKHVDRQAVSDLYDLCAGYTANMNMVLNGAFYRTPENATCGRETIVKSLSDRLVGSDLNYHDRYFKFSPASRQVLKALSWERSVTHVLGQDFLDATNLDASQVQTAIETLRGKSIKDQHVVRDPRTGAYSIDDKFFEIWLRYFDGQSVAQQLLTASQHVVRDPKESLRYGYPSERALEKEQKDNLRREGYVEGPFIMENIDGTTTEYTVQIGNNGTILSMPSDDCRRLMEGISAIGTKTWKHTLTDSDKKRLSRGETIEIEGRKYRFDLTSLTIKRKYSSRSRQNLERLKRYTEAAAENTSKKEQNTPH